VSFYPGEHWWSFFLLFVDLFPRNMGIRAGKKGIWVAKTGIRAIFATDARCYLRNTEKHVDSVDAKNQQNDTFGIRRIPSGNLT
jgi:hypothetical protein